MSALEEISKLPGYNDDGTIVAPTEEQKADALKYATETGGFPPLALWSMPQFTPAMVKLFTDKEKLVNSYPMTYITNPEKEIIYAVVSAANNCEMCLSFHAIIADFKSTLSTNFLLSMICLVIRDSIDFFSQSSMHSLS